MTTIQDPVLLHKIIEFQSCIIEGRSIKSILHKNMNFFLSRANADVITIYMHEHENVKPEYILSKNREFEHLIKKYIFHKKNFKWEKFVENCKKYFECGVKYESVTDMYQIFQGYMSRKKSDAFNKELGIKRAVIMPLYAFGDKEIMGYCCYLFKHDMDVDIEELRELKILFQTIVRPLYDEKYKTIYSKCIRLDENMGILTDKEKQIVKKVLSGVSYAEISERLDISINTLKTHMKNIFNKYNVNSKIELFNKFHVLFR